MLERPVEQSIPRARQQLHQLSPTQIDRVRLILFEPASSQARARGRVDGCFDHVRARPTMSGHVRPFPSVEAAAAGPASPHGTSVLRRPALTSMQTTYV
jgi:hypothetical protein